MHVVYTNDTRTYSSSKHFDHSCIIYRQNSAGTSETGFLEPILDSSPKIRDENDSPDPVGRKNLLKASIVLGSVSWGRCCSIAVMNLFRQYHVQRLLINTTYIRTVVL